MSLVRKASTATAKETPQALQAVAASIPRNVSRDTAQAVRQLAVGIEIWNLYPRVENF